MRTAICLLLLIALGCCFVDARRGRGRSRSRRPGDTFAGFHRDESFSVWNRTVGAREVRQEGQHNQTAARLILLNIDRRLPQLGLNFSVLLLDFSTPQPTAVLRTRRACIILERITSNLTFAAAAAELEKRNGTTVTEPLGEVRLNATGQKLTDEERGLLSPAVGNFCRPHLPVYDTTPLADSSTAVVAGPGEVVIKTLTLNDQVTILLEEDPDVGKGGRRGGRPPKP